MAKADKKEYLKGLNIEKNTSIYLNKYIAGIDKYIGIYENKKYFPVFSFRSINLNGSELCFNNPKLTAENFFSLIERLKTISNVSYEELDKGGKTYRFHIVKFGDKNVSISLEQFKQAISPNPKMIDDSNLPDCYQLDVFGYARIMGYLGYNGVFHLVWFDINHIVYS